MVTRLRLAASLAAGLLALSAAATTPIPYSGQVRQTVEDVFLEEGRPSPEKIAIYREMIEDKRDFIEEHVYDYRRDLGGEKKKKARKKGPGLVPAQSSRASTAASRRAPSM